MFYALLGSMALLGISPSIATRLIAHGTTLSRAAGVLIGASGVVSWLWLLAAVIRKGDEFEQHIQLIAIALASAATLLFVITIDWLARAQFIEPPGLKAVWLAGVTSWVISLVCTKGYYGRSQ
jgi:uncharacterized membrane protein YuzA (DUF378 family)